MKTRTPAEERALIVEWIRGAADLLDSTMGPGVASEAHCLRCAALSIENGDHYLLPDEKDSSTAPS